MEITEVKVFPVHEEKLRAFVSIVFDHCFMVNDIKVIQGRDGLFISMPSRKKKNGEFKDIAHPLNNEARRRIEDRILTAFGQIEEGDQPVRHSASSNGGPGIGGILPKSGGNGKAETVVPEPKAAEAKTLEELEELHLSDSFWSVG